MAFPNHLIINWTRHDLNDAGVCTHCGRLFSGYGTITCIYTKPDGSVYLGIPNTKVWICGYSH